MGRARAWIWRGLTWTLPAKPLEESVEDCGTAETSGLAGEDKGKRKEIVCSDGKMGFSPQRCFRKTSTARGKQFARRAFLEYKHRLA